MCVAIASTTQNLGVPCNRKWTGQQCTIRYAQSLGREVFTFAQAWSAGEGDDVENQEVAGPEKINSISFGRRLEGEGLDTVGEGVYISEVFGGPCWRALRARCSPAAETLCSSDRSQR